MLKQTVLALGLLVYGVTAVRAEVKTKDVAYTFEGVTFKGFLAWDDAAQGKRPGVLVVHEWWGLNGYARKRAEQAMREAKQEAAKAAERAEGKVEEVIGAVKNRVGAVIGNAQMEVEGRAKELKGEAKQKLNE